LFELNSKHVASLYALLIFSLIGLIFGGSYPEFALSELVHFAVLTVALLTVLGFEFKDFQERLTISVLGSIVFGLCATTTSVFGHEFSHSVWLVFPIFAVIYATSAALFLGTALVCGRQLKKVTGRTLKNWFAPHRRT